MSTWKDPKFIAQKMSDKGIDVSNCHDMDDLVMLMLGHVSEQDELLNSHKMETVKNLSNAKIRIEELKKENLIQWALINDLYESCKNDPDHRWVATKIDDFMREA